MTPASVRIVYTRSVSSEFSYNFHFPPDSSYFVLKTNCIEQKQKKERERDKIELLGIE